MARCYLFILIFFTLNYNCTRIPRPRTPIGGARPALQPKDQLEPDALKRLLTGLLYNRIVNYQCFSSSKFIPETSQWWAIIKELRPDFGYERDDMRAEYLEQFPQRFEELMLETLGCAQALRPIVFEGEIVSFNSNLKGFIDGCAKLSTLFRFVYHILNVHTIKTFEQCAHTCKRFLAKFLVDNFPDRQCEDSHKDTCHGIPCLWCLAQATGIPFDIGNRSAMITAANKNSFQDRVKMVFKCICINIAFSMWYNTDLFFQACLQKRVLKRKFNIKFAYVISNLHFLVGILARANLDASEFFKPKSESCLELQRPDDFEALSIAGASALDTSLGSKIPYSINLMAMLPARPKFDPKQRGFLHHDQSEVKGFGSPVTGPLRDETDSSELDPEIAKDSGFLGYPVSQGPCGDSPLPWYV